MVEILGKRNNKVPVILTPDVKDGILAPLMHAEKRERSAKKISMFLVSIMDIKNTV